MYSSPKRNAPATGFGENNLVFFPPNVLPTGGTARFAAGLSANEFLRGGSVIRLAKADLASLAADIKTLADMEGLTAHRRSVEVRLTSEGNAGT